MIVVEKREKKGKREETYSRSARGTLEPSSSSGAFIASAFFASAAVGSAAAGGAGGVAGAESGPAASVGEVIGCSFGAAADAAALPPLPHAAPIWLRSDDQTRHAHTAHAKVCNTPPSRVRRTLRTRKSAHRVPECTPNWHTIHSDDD